MTPSASASSPTWLQHWAPEVLLALQVIAIVIAALLLRWLLRRVIQRLTDRYELPAEINVSARRILGFLIGFGALLLVLERFGVSGSVLWTAFTGFAAVAAVAFFAAWSVLTNIFCALLLLITRPFRIHDHIELLEASDRPGLRGQVVDMNLIYVTLRESHDEGGQSVLRIPNSLFFQRSTRRWLGEPVRLAAHERNVVDPSASAPAIGGGGGSIGFP
ncbi:MAG: mechanosensitive ion channel family protein [Pseudoxanthomonas suwonensis]|nr:mechanosensitive ion channel family protein [Pseudoxanthomonas suwonensis]